MRISISVGYGTSAEETENLPHVSGRAYAAVHISAGMCVAAINIRTMRTVIVTEPGDRRRPGHRPLPITHSGTLENDIEFHEEGLYEHLPAE